MCDQLYMYVCVFKAEICCISIQLYVYVCVFKAETGYMYMYSKDINCMCFQIVHTILVNCMGGQLYVMVCKVYIVCMTISGEATLIFQWPTEMCMNFDDNKRMRLGLTTTIRVYKCTQMCI